MITNDTPVGQTVPETVAPQTESPLAPTIRHPECRHARLSTATPAAATVSERLRLDEARSHLETAGDALDGWYARQTTEGHTYVGDGHETIRLIDAVSRELFQVRAALIGEIRVDEDERAARVGRMIAEFRARPAGATPSGGTRREGGAP